MTILLSVLSAGASSGKTMKSQEFKTSGTWTRPAGVNSVFVRMVGGGGSCGYYIETTSYSAASGGHGGTYIEDVLAVTNNLTVTIGAGGAAKITNSTANGNAGGDTTVGTLVAKGGLGGTCVSMFTATGGGCSNKLAQSSTFAGAGGFIQTGSASTSSHFNPSVLNGSVPSNSLGLGAGGGGATYDTQSGNSVVGKGSYGAGSGNTWGRYWNGNFDAQANTGAGGGCVLQAGMNSLGAGGSGYAIIYWWE